MADTARRVAITRKVDLSPYGDDFEGCYAVVLLATYQDKREIKERTDLESMTNINATQFMLDTAKDHFVSGKIRVLNDDNQPELVDMVAEDIASSTEIISAIYLTIMGVSLDPKAIQTALDESSTDSATTEPSSSESNTKTTSSVAAETSTQTS